MSNQFKMTDRSVEQPTCVRISVERLPDHQPDLSWLDQTDEQMGEGFEEASEQRKADFAAGDWEMIGVRATATYLVPMGPVSITQELTSGGLWSIESDSAEEYLRTVEDEQIDELHSIMDALGVDYSTAEVYR